MERFNQVLGGILSNGAIPQELLRQKASEYKDTDSDVGQCGAINAPEEPQKFIIHLSDGVELHIPSQIMTAIVDGLGALGSDNKQECDSIGDKKCQD